MSAIYEVRCNDCGNQLDFKVSLDSGDDLCVALDACPTCIRTARDEGYDGGYKDGDSDGYARGHDEGLEEGRAEA